MLGRVDFVVVVIELMLEELLLDVNLESIDLNGLNVGRVFVDLLR